MRHTPTLALATALLTCALPAQQPVRYASGPDTLRFREITRSETRVTTARGDVTAQSDHDATIAVVRTAGDSARAWYEALDIGSTSMTGTRRPATTAVLRAPFTLRFDARGRIELLKAPTFPPEFEGVTDLTHQFSDFFMRLPAGALTMGRTWTDTSARSTSAAGKSSSTQSIATYRVERDTMVDKQPALVISMRQQLTITSAAPLPGRPMRTESTLTGTETGIVVFAPATGRMLGRRREAQLSGDLRMIAASGSTRIEQSMRYRSAIDAVR